MNATQLVDAADSGWLATLLELIRRASSELPGDIAAALRQARTAEGRAAAPEPRACAVLETLETNVSLARQEGLPLCQDTGTPTFFWRTPRGADHLRLETAARAAIAAATSRGYLRRNTLDVLSGQSIDDNVGPGTPVCHFEQHGSDATEVWLLLKGGGCENVSAQYSLPDAALGAGRDWQGVRACVLHAVWQAQGAGCAPGIIGVCVGADRAEGYAVAKRQLLRSLTDHAPEAQLAHLETQLLKEANSLAIGPMGTGGATTLLGVKLTTRGRLPASFFVTIAYCCWACRRHGLVARHDGSIKEWIGS